MKKIAIYLSLILLVFTVVSCSTLSGTNNVSEKQVLLTVSNNKEAEEVILAGEEVVFTLESNLPSNVSEDSIVWYLNDEKLEQSGRSITVKTDNDVNIRYSVCAEVDNAISNYSRVIAVTDMKYADYALAVYSFINDLQKEYGIEQVPGISLSVYGRDGDIDFNIYDGYASMNRGVKNTSDTGHILGSISKYMTAAALIKLVQEDGSTISLDQPIRTWISEDDIDPEHTGEALKKINLDETIQSLMGHTAGIGDYMNINFAFDVISAENKGLLYDVLGLVLNKRKLQYPFDEIWAPYKVFPYILADYDAEKGQSYSSPGYVLLGMIIEKYLNEKHPGTSISEYVNEVLVDPYNNTRVMLAPTDFTDESLYLGLAEQHIFDDKMDTLISWFTDINPKVLRLVGLNKEGKIVYEFNDFFKNTNKHFGKATWTAGAFVANSNQVAKINYYTLSKKTTDTISADIREIMAKDIDTEDFVYRKYSVADYSLEDENGENPIKFYGHGGKSIGQSNEICYNIDKDISITLFCDSNIFESEIYTLIRDVYVVTPELD